MACYTHTRQGKAEKVVAVCVQRHLWLDLVLGLQFEWSCCLPVVHGVDASCVLQACITASVAWSPSEMLALAPAGQLSKLVCPAPCRV